ncbi:3-deoxy-D-manno-octulosonic acid kinase [Marinomonas mediterranea]|jgi:Lipopolysaccharide kinase (Kdo/WaaP) family.|uniref:3-deoxy-D-manno-octulosonic acid kinase n=1 Tax=Marinomonas mediterranea (strain ATCC 700492 / JCM 21426 / NBRC 103028 / MMB-1) TaxID=717774 RepID=F2JZV7_MARM1|nr:3-deoxy-D-manno-octulosonic acid kinase [Marinomonas mediterranea]ADZ92069.1 3-deoxy-D-manno-octulosonic acid kinase [Marinomonas mediterranea MMB-1]WCN10032.1 3-deoxy-D-manno-octulosonic acid kinase [Marinomonas mediterranea]WCN14081.1 3-deoxy-D-manno-octulosonic acid kinase [Marinomonas mediterranea]WCN18138.1 3-deoxy-D-manno-octulosonic acid kinase [Marinomonas mediterranea MMB-1]
MPVAQQLSSKITLMTSQANLNAAQNWFDPNYWKRTKRLLKTASGRGEVWFIDSPAGPAVLRRYRRGGLIAKFNKYCFVFSSLKRTRPYKELNLLEYMVTKGLNVPTPIAGLYRKSGLLYEAWLLTKTIPDADDLFNWILEGKHSQLDWRTIGQEIKRLHDSDVFHSDLNCHNIMIDSKHKVWIIDFDKCGQRNMTQKLRDNNLDRLKRSFEKEKQKHANFHVEEANLEHLLDGYKNG